MHQIRIKGIARDILKFWLGIFLMEVKCQKNEYFWE